MSEAVRTAGRRIKKARVALGWNSLRDMEAATGIDHATIGRAENGKEPTLLNALRIARALDCQVEDLWKLS